MNGKKKSIILHLFLGGVLVCFYSCTSGTKSRENKPLPSVWLTGSSPYILLPPEDIEYPLDSHQLVSASYQGKDYFLNAWVKADTTGLNITIINELGAHLGEISYHREAASFSSPVFSLPFKPEYIIADFQLCFYRAQALRQNLENGGLFFEDTGAGRRILQGTNVIIEIEKSPHVVRLVNHLRGYAYTLEGNFE